jgi:lysophospholipase L1-like esterase
MSKSALTRRLRARAAGLLFAAVCASVAGGSSAQGPAEPWIGTWSAAPQPFVPERLITFQNQTVRLIVHGSVGGESLRLRLSNTYGHEPLYIGATRTALRLAGADIKAGSSRVVTFHGERDVTIPVGATITSDPVPIELRKFADVAISLYFPRAASAMTSHLLAMQSSYISSVAGDQTLAEHFAVGKIIHSWPLLTGVEVRSSNASGALVVFGDSMVDGDGSTMDANHRWPDYLALALNRDGGKKAIAVLGAGIVGNRLLRASPHDPPTEYGNALGESGIDRFERDALWSPATKWVIVRLGINDIGLPGPLAPAGELPRAAEIIEGYRALIKKAHQHGVRIYATTLGPFEDADEGQGYFSAQKDALRQQVNAWLRSASGFDGVVDLDAVLRDPTHPSRLLAAFDSGGHLHPNDAGNEACAAAVPLLWFADH